MGLNLLVSKIFNNPKDLELCLTQHNYRSILPIDTDFDKVFLTAYINNDTKHIIIISHSAKITHFNKYKHLLTTETNAKVKIEFISETTLMMLTQYRELLQFILRVNKQYPDYKKHILSMSLGGICTSLLPKELIKDYSIITYNSPIIKKEFANMRSILDICTLFGLGNYEQINYDIPLLILGIVNNNKLDILDILSKLHSSNYVDKSITL